jgi:hypothetical protein
MSHPSTFACESLAAGQADKRKGRADLRGLDSFT